MIYEYKYFTDFLPTSGQQALSGTRMALEEQVERLTQLLDRMEKRVGSFSEKKVYFHLSLLYVPSIMLMGNP